MHRIKLIAFAALSLFSCAGPTPHQDTVINDDLARRAIKEQLVTQHQSLGNFTITLTGSRSVITEQGLLMFNRYTVRNTKSSISSDVIVSVLMSFPAPDTQPAEPDATPEEPRTPTIESI